MSRKHAQLVAALARKGLVLFFLSAFQQAASKALGYGVRVNVLCPSFVQTELFTSCSSKLGQFSHLAHDAFEVAEKMGLLS